MIRVVILCEGQSEETFVRDMLMPIFSLNEIYITPRLINTSPKQKGGALTYDRVKRFTLNTLKEDSNIYVTTFFDLYAIDKNFPNLQNSLKLNSLDDKVSSIESAFKIDVDKNGTFGDRFMPYIQAYEFEALIFSDIQKLVEIDTWDEKKKIELQKIRDEFETPEHINNSKQTAPSIRIKNILTKPKYDKKLHGSLALCDIGIDKILSECSHFSNWYDKILNLRILEHK